MKSPILIILFTALLPPRHLCDNLQAPIVGIELSEAGMHRDLTYTVQFDYPLAGKDCDYILEQSLPAGAYVSVDQLHDLKRLKKLDTIYPAFVDIEAPMEKSAGFQVLIRGAPKVTDTKTLPIHLRYHAPSDKKSFATVTLSTPKMYLNCPANEAPLIDNELRLLSSESYCLHPEEVLFRVHAPEEESDDCDWKLIDIDFQLKTTLSAEVPVGNEKAFPPILYATIIISWLVSLWTVFRTRAVPIRINQKLEEQRVLHQKTK